MELIKIVESNKSVFEGLYFLAKKYVALPTKHVLMARFAANLKIKELAIIRLKIERTSGKSTFVTMNTYYLYKISFHKRERQCSTITFS